MESDFPPPSEVPSSPTLANAAHAPSVLEEALEKKRTRFFRASGGSARGKSGRVDTERFADELMLLQECSQLVGERLAMSAITYAMIYDREETSAYSFDAESNPTNPQIVGALANRRAPMHDLLTQLEDFQNE